MNFKDVTESLGILNTLNRVKNMENVSSKLPMAVAMMFAIGFASSPVLAAKCIYDLNRSSGQIGSAEVEVDGLDLKIEIKGAFPETMYTVWIDFRNRGTLMTPSDYPNDALPRGVAPAFGTTDGTTNGIELDLNAIVTNNKGDGKLSRKLDYAILEVGSSPVVSADLGIQNYIDSSGNQKVARIGGHWLRRFNEDGTQKVDGDGFPVLPRSTPQGITIVRHPDFVSHGHTPGVGGVDHFSAFSGDFPNDCLPSTVVTAAATLDLGDDKKTKWELTNNGNRDVFITRVEVSWPAEHQKVKKFKLEGDFAKDVNDTASPTAVPDNKAFENDANKRKLKKGTTKKLEIEFDKGFKGHTQSDYTITVEFDNGQTLVFP